MALPLQAENDTVHKFSFELNSLIINDSIRDPEYTADFVWEPEVYGDFDACEIVFEPIFLFPVESNAVFSGKINELRVSFSLSDYIDFSAGKYIHDSSFAAFFSKTAFFRTTDYQELLKGNLNSAVTSSWLAECSFYTGDLYFRAGFEPFREKPPFFDPGSVWFPDLGFNKIISSPFAPDGVIELAEIRIVEPEQQNIWYDLIQDFGGTFEFGGRIGPLDFLSAFYTGLDSAPLYSAEIILKNLVDDFSVDLHPVEERVYALGAAVRGAAGPVVLYGETAFYFNKPFVKDTFYSTSAGFETETYTSEYLCATIGGRWEWWDANLFITAEYTDGFIFNPAPGTIAPFFQHMVLASLIWTPLENQFNISLNGIADADDGSVGAGFSIEYLPWEGRVSFKLGLPLFFGSPDSSLGQYRQIIYPTFSSYILF